MTRLSLFNKLGLSHNQARIYITLVEKGPLTIAGIAREGELHRPVVYKEVPKLLAQELITRTPKGSRTEYTAESPKKLKKLLETTHEEIELLIPHLESIYQTREKKPLVKFLEGRRSIVHVFDDVVETLGRGDVFYRYSSRKDLQKGRSYLPGDYRTRRDAKGLERMVISSKSMAKWKKPRLEREIKILEDAEFAFGIAQLIYANKVAFVDYNSETALIIENPSIAKFQKQLFLSLYKRL